MAKIVINRDAAEPRPDPRHRQRHLVRTLLRHDLIDRLNLWIYPVLFGSGKQLFARRHDPHRIVAGGLGGLQLTHRSADLRARWQTRVGNMAWDADQAGDPTSA